MGADFSHFGAHHGVCGCCHRSPCCCHGPVLGAAMKTLKLGLGTLTVLKDACHDHDWGWCHIPEGTDIIVHALPGELRIVPYQVKNDTQCPVTLKPELKPWSRCGCEDKLDAKPPVLKPEGPWELPACGAVNFDIVIDTAGMKPCQCYCATLYLHGSSCEPVQIALCIGGKIPAACHHDISKLRAWVRTCCFTGKGPRYVVHPPFVKSCKRDCD